MNSDRMAALQELISRIRPGWTVKVVNHDYTAGSGTRAVVSVTRTELRTKLGRAVHSQGRKFTTSYLRWPGEGDDFEVRGGELRTYRQSYGSRVIALTLTFIAGRGE